MAIVLSIETSTSVCSVALHENGKLISVLEVRQENSHASKLAVLVHNLIEIVGIRLKDVEAIGLSSGPGSYTGLRIGTSLAKGLCYGLDIPLITVNSLTLLAHRMSINNAVPAFLCPMIDARRMEVYCQIVDFDLKEQESISAKIIDEQSFQNYLDIKPVIFFGSGAEKCKNIIRHRNAIFFSDVHPSAIHLGELAFKKYSKNQVENLSEFVPLYLKEFLISKEHRAI